MPANLENSAVVTGLEKVSFHSNPKERKCQRLLKLPPSSTHLTCYHSNAQNSKPGFNNMWTVNFPMFKLVLQKAEEPEIKLPMSAGSLKKQGVPEKHLFLVYWLCQTFDIVDHNKLWKILKEMGIPDHLTCLLKNLCAGQEATVRTGHGTTDWFQIGKGLSQGCILSPCLFNLYAEYIMRNAGLDESQARIKIIRRNINNLRYADATILMAENKEELKILLMSKTRMKKLA